MKDKTAMLPCFYTTNKWKYDHTIRILINVYQNLVADTWKCGFVTNNRIIMDERKEVIKMRFVNPFLHTERHQTITH